MTPTRKKLIEVALPLEAINEEGSRRKRKAPSGYPTTLHKWWAQRPPAAARAVIFAQMVDDPSEYVDTLKSDPKLKRHAQGILKSRHKLWKEATELKEKADAAGISAPAPGPEPALDDILAEIERNRLFRIIEELVKWENTTNESVLQAARQEIWQSWRRTCAENADHPRAKELFDRHKLPAFHDPFAGGGTLPLEAQRLGLESHASDLNPVAVLINKAMIEIPPKFANQPPVNPDACIGQLGTKTWRGPQGLAEDLRYYGRWMRDEAERRIGHLYPKIEITTAMAKERPDLKPLVGEKLTVIAWLWTRTVKSPNPAFRDVDVPLTSTFMLSSKAGKEVYVEPIIENGGYHFTVKVGKPKSSRTASGTTAGKRHAFKCLMSDAPVTYEYIREEGKTKGLGARLMAIVVEGKRGRLYLPPTVEQENLAREAEPDWIPELALPDNPRDFKTPNYGIETFGHLFTPRQLLALTTLSDLVGFAFEQIYRDFLVIRGDSAHLNENVEEEAKRYAQAICTYASMAISRLADYGSSIATWRPKDNAMRSTMPKQAVQMAWDFAEGSPFGSSSSGFTECVDVVAKVIDLALPCGFGMASQGDAQNIILAANGVAVVSTDPPYYDNIGYADLSDFFHIWLRASLRPFYPNLFATVAAPKAEELVATPYRHGNKKNAEEFFLDGMTKAMHRLAEQSHPDFPVTIYYAFKQSESTSHAGTASTGWETFLDAVILAGFGISGTWPMRTEGDNRQLSIGNNALASSIVIVCRTRAADAPTATRREFVAALQRELPVALRHLQAGNIAPVDLAQAAIGPGMAVFTRYARVLDAQGKPLSVREALALINETLDTALAEQEGDFDPDSRWALAWFDQFGFDEGEFGVALVLATAKNTSVDGLQQAGVVFAKAGRVRLLRPEELSSDWDPATDSRLTHWETVHHMIRVLATGESAAAELVSKLGAKAEPARELAYRLYTLCERKKRAAEALAYNGLVQAWPDILRIAEENPQYQDPIQGELL